MKNKKLILGVLFIILLLLAVIFIYRNNNGYYEIKTTITEGKGAIDIFPQQENYKKGSTITIEAIPESGYTFVNWGTPFLSNNKRHIVIEEDITIEARFTQNINWNKKIDTNSETSLFQHYKMVSDEDAIYLLNGFNNISAFDLNGNEIWKRKLNIEENDIEYGFETYMLLSNKGIYTIIENKLIFIDKNGNIKWRKDELFSDIISARPMLDRKNNIYLCNLDYLYVINNKGEVKYNYKLPVYGFDISDITIINEKNIMIVDNTGKLYSIGF